MTPPLEKAVDSPWIFVALMIIGAISFATALAWNDAARTIAEEHIGTDDSSQGMITYALIMTAALIILSYCLAMVAPSVLKDA